MASPFGGKEEGNDGGGTKRLSTNCAADERVRAKAELPPTTEGYDRPSVYARSSRQSREVRW